MDIISDLIKKNRLKKTIFPEEMILKEFQVSQKDFESAQKSFVDENYKWSIIQSYYAIFHAARSIIFRSGYREESHTALKIAFKHLYVDTDMISKKTFLALERGMSLREMADYKETYSQKSAENILFAVNDAINEIKAYHDMLTRK